MAVCLCVVINKNWLNACVSVGVTCLDLRVHLPMIRGHLWRSVPIKWRMITRCQSIKSNSNSTRSLLVCVSAEFCWTSFVLRKSKTCLAAFSPVLYLLIVTHSYTALHIESCLKLIGRLAKSAKFIKLVLLIGIWFEAVFTEQCAIGSWTSYVTEWVVILVFI